jgi:hypothetical protein
MNTSTTYVEDALRQHPDSQITVAYCAAADDWVAQFFDGDHEAAALIATSGSAMGALNNLAEMIREDLV